MPYYMRQALLNRTLESYKRLYGHLDYEVVVCDDGSPEPVEAEEAVIVSLPRKDYVLNPCVPMNRAVEASSGEVIVLTNPEIEHRVDVLTPMLGLLSENAYVIAACWDVTTRRWLAHSGTKNGQLPIPAGSGFHFCAMLSRGLWDRAGGFDEDYRDGFACEDTDWLWRLHSVGAEFLMCDDLVVYHSRTHNGWGRSKLAVNEMLFRKKWQ